MLRLINVICFMIVACGHNRVTLLVLNSCCSSFEVDESAQIYAESSLFFAFFTFFSSIFPILDFFTFRFLKFSEFPISRFSNFPVCDFSNFKLKNLQIFTFRTAVVTAGKTSARGTTTDEELIQIDDESECDKRGSLDVSHNVSLDERCKSPSGCVNI